MTYFEPADQQDVARLCEHFRYPDEAELASAIYRLRVAADEEPADEEARAKAAMLDALLRITQPAHPDLIDDEPVLAVQGAF